MCFGVCRAEAASWFVVFGSLVESANMFNGARRGFADFRQIRGNYQFVAATRPDREREMGLLSLLGSFERVQALSRPHESLEECV